MSIFVDEMLKDGATTLNGAKTYKTSLSPILDLFFIAGASRNISEEDLTRMLSAAFAANQELTLNNRSWLGNKIGLKLVL